jgi:protein ImuB
MDEARAMLTVLAHDLAARPPLGAIVGVAVQAHAVPRRAVAGVLGRPAAPAMRDLATIFARLAALVGPDNVGAVAPADSHHPDAWAPAPLRLDADDEPAGQASAEPVLALRRLRPPRRVVVDTDPAGRPRVVLGALSEAARVLRCAGPWRASGEWWDGDRWSREEWDVALDDRTVVRLVADRLDGSWHLDGVYD